MPDELWINLPIDDTARSKSFYEQMGFPTGSVPGNNEAFSVSVGDKGVAVMFFPRATFEGFISAPSTDTGKSNEVLLSIGAASRAELDDLVERARGAGGTVFGEPSANGPLYGAGFSDPDGHRWNILYIDASQM